MRAYTTRVRFTTLDDTRAGVACGGHLSPKHNHRLTMKERNSIHPTSSWDKEDHKNQKSHSRSFRLGRGLLLAIDEALSIVADLYLSSPPLDCPVQASSFTHTRIFRLHSAHRIRGIEGIIYPQILKTFFCRSTYAGLLPV
jgi:hypothetical protein